MNLRGPTRPGAAPRRRSHAPAANTAPGRRDSTLNRINARYYANAIVTKMAAIGQCFKNPSPPILRRSSAGFAAKPGPSQTGLDGVSPNAAAQLRRPGANDGGAIAQFAYPAFSTRSE